MKDTGASPLVACQRCRQKKTRCDRGFPRCRPCEKFDEPCLTIEPWSGRVIPRSYLSRLEERVAELEMKLTEHKEVKTTTKPVPRPANSTSFLGASSGLTFARILGSIFREQVGSEEPHTRVSTNNLSTTPSAKSRTTVAQQASHIHLPEKAVAEEYLERYFNLSNTQMPILHREDFIQKYFEPVYGPISPGLNLGCTFTQPALQTSTAPPGPNTLYQRLSKVSSYRDLSTEDQTALYFLLQVFSIAVAGHMQLYPAYLPERLQFHAMTVYETAAKSEDGYEALQAVLLLALYSVMRPADPGIWYVIGTAMRMCVEMGIHNEDRRKRQVYVSSGEPANDALRLDMARRLFWCTYSLDRQICVYLGRPNGLGDEYIKVPYPSLIDDAYVLKAAEQHGTLPHATTGPSYKHISLAFFQLRYIQARVQHVLYDLAEVPRAYGSLEHWRSEMMRELDEWYRSIPTDERITNCQFNVGILSLNYHQTRLLLYGMSPAAPRPSPADMNMCADSGRQIIELYHRLYTEERLNYTWAAVHNLFFAGTSYLYVLHHSEDERRVTNSKSVQTLIDEALAVMTFLQKYTDSATPCLNSLRRLAEATVRLMVSESEKVELTEFYHTSDSDDPLSSGNDNKVYDFISQMQQSFIWEPFLANSEPAPPHPHDIDEKGQFLSM
ncbi:Pyrimidine pathway regulatory protein 1 [Wickerhamiella sorbophila]|uniref:Pyrimidine pathway regulatory protein 1 n=1 Tax=Wickerhamiella sorbophila TaxID=45607 RepID=A0A2T0FIG3_9ASCO|nr:Pyrimidine pathway regulatory protein 1 [Wickerhamiella sorbophila]PRT54791.1 Pyrimidine pathway regulatory protein 1 [Wickerhamiella sorbophila]